MKKFQVTLTFSSDTLTEEDVNMILQEYLNSNVVDWNYNPVYPEIDGVKELKEP